MREREDVAHREPRAAREWKRTLEPLLAGEDAMACVVEQRGGGQAIEHTPAGCHGPAKNIYAPSASARERILDDLSFRVRAREIARWVRDYERARSRRRVAMHGREV